METVKWEDFIKKYRLWATFAFGIAEGLPHPPQPYPVWSGYTMTIIGPPGRQSCVLLYPTLRVPTLESALPLLYSCAQSGAWGSYESWEKAHPECINVYGEQTFSYYHYCRDVYEKMALLLGSDGLDTFLKMPKAWDMDTVFNAVTILAALEKYLNQPPPRGYTSDDYLDAGMPRYETANVLVKAMEWKFGDVWEVTWIDHDCQMLFQGARYAWQFRVKEDGIELSPVLKEFLRLTSLLHTGKDPRKWYGNVRFWEARQALAQAKAKYPETKSEID